MERVHVRPREGLVVRDPETLQPLPPEGREVDLTTYWIRRLADGDVVTADAPVTEPAGGAE